MKYNKAWEQAVFTAGEAGYSVFRIPAVITLPNGRVLALAEGRRNSVSDSGEIDIVQKISTDGGRTFGELTVTVSGGGNTAGNPCPVYDAMTGRIVMTFNRNNAEDHERIILRGLAPRTVHVIESADGGETWGEERDITASVKHEDWTWYAMGPCHALQTASGRLVFPCNHAVLNPETGRSFPYRSHTIYSDDHGASWHIGADIAENTNECGVVQLEDGALLMNMRSFHREGCRALAVSRSEGETFEEFRMEHTLPDPCCQGAVLTVRRGGKEVVLFSNSSSPTERVNMSIHESIDGGLTWTEGVVVTAGPSAYSDLTELDGGRIAVMYETGRAGMPYDEIRWVVYDTEA